jgi:hypothetical protein
LNWMYIVISRFLFEFYHIFFPLSSNCRMKISTDTIRMSSLCALMWHPQIWIFQRGRWIWYSQIGFSCISLTKRWTFLILIPTCYFISQYAYGFASNSA